MPKKTRADKLLTESGWWQRAAKIMVREDRNLWQAAMDVGTPVTQDEADLILKNPIFKQVLEAERIKRFNELAEDPNRGKNTIKGQAIVCIDRLMEAQQYDKALAGILTYAKIDGIVGADSNVNVFSGLSTKELADMRKELAAGAAAEVKQPESKAAEAEEFSFLPKAEGTA